MLKRVTVDPSKLFPLDWRWHLAAIIIWWYLWLVVLWRWLRRGR